jgi:hypothetical protein
VLAVKQPQTTRDAVWQRVAERLAESDAAAARLIDVHAARVPAFFADKKQHAPAFADDVLSWTGLWHWAESKVWGAGDEHDRHVRACFARHFFQDEDLRALVAGAVEGFSAELDGLEAQLLVQLKADLPDKDLAVLGVAPAFPSSEALQAEFRRLQQEVARVPGTDAAVLAGREAVNWSVGGLLISTALRLAVSSGQSSFFSLRSLTIVAVVGIALDTALRWIIRQAGHDPEQEVIAQVQQLFDRLSRLLVEGEPDGRTPGLRAGLRQLSEQRARQREAALKKLILGL